MVRSTAFMRSVFSLLFVLVVLAVLPAYSQQDDGPARDEAAWQEVITGQIEALRRSDGAAALEFAGMAFKAGNPRPGDFLAWVRRTGYGAIIDSVSHSFGAFETRGNDRVLQIVTIIGEDQRIHRALYQLGTEPDGWRILGVVLQDQQAIAI